MEMIQLLSRLSNVLAIVLGRPFCEPVETLFHFSVKRHAVEVGTVFLLAKRIGGLLIIKWYLGIWMQFDVIVEMIPEKFSDVVSEISKQEKALESALLSVLQIKAKVKLVAPKSIARSEGKAKRVIRKKLD